MHQRWQLRAIELLRAGGYAAEADGERGPDHGAKVPLCDLLPRANVPVFQVSLPERFDGPAAYDYGRALAPLANEGVLIAGSGSLTHNRYQVQRDAGAQGEGGVAHAFESAQWLPDMLHGGDHARLVHAMDLAPSPNVPTPQVFGGPSGACYAGWKTV